MKQFYSYIKNGYISKDKRIQRQAEGELFPNLSTYIKQPFEMKPEDSIAYYSVDTAVEEIKKMPSSKRPSAPTLCTCTVLFQPHSKNRAGNFKAQHLLQGKRNAIGLRRHFSGNI